MTTERWVCASCRKKLESMGFKVIPYPGGMYGETGTPDLIACREGRLVMVETKATGQHLRPIQERRFAEWRAVGAVCIEAHSADEMADQIFSALGFF